MDSRNALIGKSELSWQLSVTVFEYQIDDLASKLIVLKQNFSIEPIFEQLLLSEVLDPTAYGLLTRVLYHRKACNVRVLFWP